MTARLRPGTLYSFINSAKLSRRGALPGEPGNSTTVSSTRRNLAAGDVSFDPAGTDIFAGPAETPMHIKTIAASTTLLFMNDRGRNRIGRILSSKSSGRRG